MTAETAAAPAPTTAPPRPTWLRVPVWAWRVLAVYAASRVLATTALLIARNFQGEAIESWFGGHPRPPYGVFVSRWWDGWWYEQIWAHGYPSTLPISDGSLALPAGVVDLNEWAFFPLYPMLVKAITAVTGGTWVVVAPLVALVLGAAALLVVHRVVEVAAPRAVQARPGLPLATVAVVAFFPPAVVFQTAYTESLALLLVATSLLLIVRRRYAWAMLAVGLLGFSRAVALPMAAVVAVHLLLRWRASRASGPAREPWPRREAVLGVVLLGVSGLSGGIWPLIAGWVTGRATAYLDTQAAWRPARGLGLFAGWVRVEDFSPLGVAITVASVGLVVALLVLPAGRRLGPELWTWSATYVAYLAAVGDLISSQIRFLLLAFPLAAALVGLVTRPRWAARTWLAVLLVGLAVAQVAWVWTVWIQVMHETTFLRAP